MSQLSELEIEALPEETIPSPEERGISSSRKKSDNSLPTILENGAAMVSSTSFNGRVSSHTCRDASPPSKRFRKEKKQLGPGPLENSYVKKQMMAQQDSGWKTSVLSAPSSPLASVGPVADSSTRVDSPSHELVTSSLCNPSPSLVLQTPQSPSPRPCIYKVSWGGFPCQFIFTLSLSVGVAPPLFSPFSSGYVRACVHSDSFGILVS